MGVVGSHRRAVIVRRRRRGGGRKRRGDHSATSSTRRPRPSEGLQPSPIITAQYGQPCDDTRLGGEELLGAQDVNARANRLLQPHAAPPPPQHIARSRSSAMQRASRGPGSAPSRRLELARCDGPGSGSWRTPRETFGTGASRPSRSAGPAAACVHDLVVPAGAQKIADRAFATVVAAMRACVSRSSAAAENFDRRVRARLATRLLVPALAEPLWGR